MRFSLKGSLRSLGLVLASQMRRAVRSKLTCASAIVTPGLSRPINLNQADLRSKFEVVADNNCRRIINGAQTSAGVSSLIPANPAGATPMMV